MIIVTEVAPLVIETSGDFFKVQSVSTEALGGLFPLAEVFHDPNARIPYHIFVVAEEVRLAFSMLLAGVTDDVSKASEAAQDPHRFVEALHVAQLWGSS